MAPRPGALAAPDSHLMRILSVGNMYPPHHLGGYELIWQDADQHLSSAGHDVRVLTTDHAEPGVSEPDAANVHRELRWYWRDHDWPRLGARGRLALERHNGRVFGAHLEDFEPDAIAWWSMGGMSLSLLERARRAGVPGVGVICDEWLVYGPAVDQWTRAFRRRPWLRGIVEPLARVPTGVDLAASARYLYLSDVLRRDAAAADPRLGEGEVVHRGPDVRHFREAPEQRWSWRLLYVGRIDPRKGIDVAIRAMPELAGAHLTIVGSGDAVHAAELRALAAELGVAERVSFTAAAREDLQEVYAGADAVVFPVRWREPWGLVPLEAMAVGRPVVATGMGGSAEYLEDGRNCLIYDPERGAPALAARLLQLSADPELRARLRAGGLATATGISAHRYNERIELALAEATAQPAG